MKKIKIFNCNYYQKEVFTKVFRVMKITVFLFLVVISSAFAGSTYSQNTRLSLHLDRVSIQQVFDEIQKKSEFIVFYKDSQLDVSHLSDVDVNEGSVDQILDQALKSTDLGYKIIDRQIVIISNKTKDSPTADASETSAEQKREITGIVKDAKGVSLPGVSVVVKGTTLGTTTDNSGKFTLSVPTDAKTLIFSFIGLKSQETVIGNNSSVKVVMEQETFAIDEVVAIGYGVVKKSDLTSSIGVVTGREISAMVTNNVSEALQGKVAGVQVVNSGAPGQAPQVMIRGVSTFNLSTDPLYIVDGVPNGGGYNISANDIENIQVLKDASAAAIYGSRASNGVILITTKQGKIGKPVVSANVQYGMENNTKKYHMADAVDYATIYNAATTNSGMSNFYGDPSQYAGKTTNWWGAGIKGLTPQRNIGMEISGGTESIKYFGSIYYNDKNSVFQTGGGSEKLTIRFNAQFKFSEHVDGGVSISPIFSKYGYPNNYRSYYLIDPITPIKKTPDQLTGNEQEYDTYSRSPSGIWNPVAEDRRYDDYTHGNSLPINAFINIKPIAGLIIRSQFSYSADNFQRRQFSPQFVIDQANEKNLDSQVYNQFTLNNSYSLINTVAYSKEIKKHSLMLMAGQTLDHNSFYDLEATRYDTPNNQDYLRELNAGTGAQTNSGYSASDALISYLGRLTYNYDNKYFLTATYRRDGSSKFMAANKWATFPSASVAWKISEESFMKDLKPVLSTLKLRLGWGQVGNQGIPSDVYQSRMDFKRMAGISGPGIVAGFQPGSIANKSIKWETVEDKNIGFDFGFKNDKLTGSIEYYEKNTNDMLFNRSFPWYSGYPGDDASIWFNVGNMQTKGMDFTLAYKDNIGKFNYGAQLNVTTFQSKTTKLPSGAPIYNGNSKTVEGDEPAYFNGFVADGIFQNQSQLDAYTINGVQMQPNARVGDIRFKDLNNDKKIDGNDQTKIGSPWAKFTAGLNLFASYGNFDFRADFYSSYGNKLTFQERSDLYGSLQNRENKIAGLANKAWHGEGTSTTIPILNYNDPNNNFRFSTLSIQDGSFLRLRNISIGYTIPELWGIKNTRLSLSGQNLFTLTKYEGTNPEQMGSVSAYGVSTWAYPLAPTVFLGVKFSL